MSRLNWKLFMFLPVVLLFSACTSTTQTGGSVLTSTPTDPLVLATMPATPTAAFDCAVVTEIPVAECQALAVFFEATGGLQWPDSSGWLQTTTPCSWLGVSCANGHVDMLALFFNNLQGALPSSLAELTQLRVLDLHNNALTGPIPTDLGRLSALEYLDFSVNQFNGPMPGALGDLAALQGLYLPHNQLSGPIPAEIGKLASLRNIDLSYNQLESAIPDSLADLTALETIRLRHNQLEGAIPFGLGELAALAEIDLSFNQLTGTIPSALYQVPIHRLWGNQLEGTILLEDGRQSVNYLGVTFTFDQMIAGSVFPELAPARSAEPGPGVMWAPPEHMVFTFAGTSASPDHSPLGQYLPPEAQIHIYPTAGLNAEVQPIVAALQQLLADPSALAAYQSVGPETEPFQPGLAMLPPSNAVQAFRAQVQRLAFAGGAGVRYLTQLSQGPTPVNNQDMFYTFQGLTDDGATYVAAYFPVSLPDLPNLPQIDEAAFMTLMEDWAGYLAQVADLLNMQPAAAFTPDLAALDSLVSSLSVAGVTPVRSITGIWPEDGESVDAQPVLQWEAQPGAVNYHVVVLDDAAYPPQVIIDQTVLEPMLAVSAPLLPGHYSWTVWANDSDGDVLAQLASAFVVAGD